MKRQFTLLLMFVLLHSIRSEEFNCVGIDVSKEGTLDIQPYFNYSDRRRNIKLDYFLRDLKGVSSSKGKAAEDWCKRFICNYRKLLNIPNDKKSFMNHITDSMANITEEIFSKPNNYTPHLFVIDWQDFEKNETAEDFIARNWNDTSFMNHPLILMVRDCSISACKWIVVLNRGEHDRSKEIAEKPLRMIFFINETDSTKENWPFDQHRNILNMAIHGWSTNALQIDKYMELKHPEKRRRGEIDQITTTPKPTKEPEQTMDDSTKVALGVTVPLVVIVIVLVVAGGFYLWWRVRRSQNKAEEEKSLRNEINKKLNEASLLSILLSRFSVKIRNCPGKVEPPIKLCYCTFV